jgi:hypothetical protein
MADKELTYAVIRGDAPHVARILRDNPDIINMKVPQETSLLRIACYQNSPEIVSVLLKHPKIDINYGGSTGTPFGSACWKENIGIVKLLLDDPRLNPLAHDPRGSILNLCIQDNKTEVIKVWLASGRAFAPWSAGVYEGYVRSAAELVRRSRLDLEGTRHSVRLELGWYSERASEILAQVVFLSDGLLQMGPPVFSRSAARFFEIAKRLPFELQMILCYRVAGARRTLIPEEKREAGFRSLAKKLVSKT